MKVTKQIESKITIEFTREEILDLLKRKVSDIPDNAELYVMVPSGGDWSGCALDLDSGTQLTLTYIKREEKVK